MKESIQIMDNKIILYAADEQLQPEAEKIAEHLQIELVGSNKDLDKDTLVLVLDSEGLALTDGDLKMRGDYNRMLPRLKQSNLERELLIQAARIKGKEKNEITVIDATAGMGEDSLLLAAAGYHVKLFEYDPLIAALLADTMRRAKQIPEMAAAVGRMELFEGDSISALKNLDTRPDIVYLDPMFPERQKSALVKKKFQLLHYVELPCSNETEMLEAAFEAHPHKIIIKRPLKGPYLADKKPGYFLSGKAIRYDCHVLA